MNLHEYQAKKILANYGVPVPEGLVAANPDEAEAAARALGGEASKPDQPVKKVSDC